MLYKPLYTLKKGLLEALNMSDDHFYQVFCTYRFRGSMRKSEDFGEHLNMLRKLQLGENIDAKDIPEWLRLRVKGSVECIKANTCDRALNQSQQEGSFSCLT